MSHPLSRRALLHAGIALSLVASAGPGLAQDVYRFDGGEVTHNRSCGPGVPPTGSTSPIQPDARSVVVSLGPWQCFGVHDGTAAFSFPQTVARKPGTSDQWAFDQPATVSVAWSWASLPSPYEKDAYLLVSQLEPVPACRDYRDSPFDGYPAGSTITPQAAIACPEWRGSIGGASRFAVQYNVHSAFRQRLTSGENGYQSLNVKVFYMRDDGVDLEVTLAHRERPVNDPPVWDVTVRNRGGATANDASLTLWSESTVLKVEPACLQGSPFSPACGLGAVAPGEERKFVVSTDLGRNNDRSADLSARVSTASVDVHLPNNEAFDRQMVENCFERAGTACLFVDLACEATTSRLAEGLQPPGAGLGARLLRSLAESTVDTSIFRRLRDEVFSRSAAGRRTTELYYAHARELATLVAASPSLLSATLANVLAWQPHVRALVTGEGAATAVLTSEQVDGLLGVIAQLESLGSPELAAVLARERAARDLPSLVGKTVHEALAIQQETVPDTVTVPAAASIHGVAPAFFHSDLRVLNPATSGAVTVAARYRCFTGPCPADTEKSFTVNGRELKVFEDAVVSLFGAPETAGTIELTGPVLAESRVYTPTLPAPTSGSDVPGLPVDEAFAESVLLSLSRGAFRTNVGVYNPGPDVAAVTVTLHAPGGTKLGEVKRDVSGRSAVQVNDVFGAAGIAGDVPDVYAVVRADGVRELYSYATVIDNRSQDSVFVKGRNARGADPERVTLPAAASIHGVPPAFFHSDVRVFNPSPDAAATVTATYRCFTGACPAVMEKSFEVAPREMKVLDDVVATLFAAPETAGAIELSGRVHVESRVYTPERGAPTTGTSIPGQPAVEATTQAALLSLSHSAAPGLGFRTNVGVYNPAPEPHAVTISLRRPDGTQLAVLSRTVPPFLPLQVNDAFGAAGVTQDVPAAWALVSGDGVRGFFAYATVIDNQSQDSVFVKGRPLRVP
ncbi:MAG: hypothetical protein RBU36_01085 [Thermoanaerobaculia bacterium]|jgi:hypothetical protein|nr:hypothetical protein [Thermoanaerobaculia bacterium]